MTSTVGLTPPIEPEEDPRPRRSEFALPVVGFTVDALFALDRYVLRDVFALDPDAIAVLALGALGFSYLVFRRRFPVAVFWLTLAHAVALSALTHQRYTPVIATWLAMHSVAELRGGLNRYAVLLASLTPSVLMAAYLHSVTVEPTSNVVAIVVAAHIVLVAGVWQDGSRRRAPHPE